jgi:hypothetical protein
VMTIDSAIHGELISTFGSKWKTPNLGLPSPSSPPCINLAFSGSNVLKILLNYILNTCEL